MRWVGLFTILALLVLLFPIAVKAYGGEDCDYDPTCNEVGDRGENDCAMCERPYYETACDGGCNYSAYDCLWDGACPFPNDHRTTTEGCPSGYVKDQLCSASMCDWIDTSTCYLDPSGDADGDGVSNSVDDCPQTYAPSPPNCNGCPDEICSGCLSLEPTCPASGARACIADDTKCTDYQCPSDGCVGNNWCTYDGGAICDEGTGQCACLAGDCQPDPRCADTDGDGVPDANDQCPGTPQGEAIDPGTGCSCSQIPPCDDGKECTSDSCDAGTCIFTNLAPGTPCNGGVCDGAGVCVAQATCSATPGCLASQPAGAHVVVGTCTDQAETCYACNVGTTWDPAAGACVSDACGCTPGATRCDGDTFLECSDAGCWVSTLCTGATPRCTMNGCVGCVSADDCDAGESCVAGQCVGACADTCASLGFACGRHEVCGSWVSCGSCGAGEMCNGTACVAGCRDACTLGSSRCRDGSVETCVADGACTTWQVTTTCGGDTPFCVDADGSASCVACRDSHDCSADAPYCQAGACVAVSVSPSSMTVSVGEAVTTQFSLSPAGEYAVAVDADLSSYSVDYPLFWFQPSAADLGTHAVTLEVSQASRLLATLSVPVRVTCPENAGACCPAGSTAYAEAGTACSLAEGSVGACDGQGRCVENCVATGAVACAGDVLRAVDSCGVFGEVVADCGAQGLVCVEEPSPSCVAPPPSCSGVYVRECRDGSVYGVDAGCGAVVLLESCAADEACVEADGSASCVVRGPCSDEPGTLACGGDCVDPLTDRRHCGGCGRSCARDEQCVEGSCVVIPGCVVVCDGSGDCGPGEVCLFPGSCTESQCAPVAPVAPLWVADDLVGVNVSLVEGSFVFSVVNVVGVPVRANVTVSLPKFVVQRAADLSVEGAELVVVADDPVVRFPVAVDGSVSL